jgi:hypothetical protein
MAGERGPELPNLIPRRNRDRSIEVTGFDLARAFK